MLTISEIRMAKMSKIFKIPTKIKGIKMVDY